MSQRRNKGLLDNFFCDFGISQSRHGVAIERVTMETHPCGGIDITFWRVSLNFHGRSEDLACSTKVDSPFFGEFHKSL
jgi:hypothetical protein